MSGSNPRRLPSITRESAGRSQKLHALVVVRSGRNPRRNSPGACLHGEAGLGGVEIQITYPLQEDSEAQGIKNLTYYSPEFIDILDYTLTTAEEMGLFVDLTLCSGWPFGGPFVPVDMAPEVLIPYQIDVIGPTEYEQDFTTVLPGKPSKAVMGKFENGAIVADTLLDITDRLDQTWLHGWAWGHCLNKVSIPEGHWKI